MKRNIQEIFNECLERKFNGEPVDALFAQYPEFAIELKSLLVTTLAVRNCDDLAIDKSFKTSLKNEVLTGIRDAKEKPINVTPVFRTAWFVTVTAVMLIMVLLSGTVVAASSSMPDGILYPVKLASEQVRLSFKTNNVSKLEYSAELANIRVSELIYVLNSSDVDFKKLDAASKRLEHVLNQIKTLANTSSLASVDQITALADVRDKERSDVIKALALYAVTNSQILEDKMQVAPDTIKPAIENAIDQTIDSFDQAIKSIEEGNK
jgi:hypothetical protein